MWDSRFYYYIFLFQVSDSTLEGIGMEKEEGKNTSKASKKKKRSQHKQEENDTIPKAMLYS